MRTTKLLMTPSLRRSIALLSFPKPRLIRSLEEALQGNPHLIEQAVLPFPTGLPVETDVTVFHRAGRWQAAVNWDGIPRLSVSRARRTTPGVEEPLLHDARSLVDAVARRAEIVHAVTEHAVAHQALFLSGRRAAPLPLAYRTAATRLKLHESTVGRAVSGKILYHDGQTMPLAGLFDGGRRQLALHRVADLVGGEGRSEPLSDERLANLLRQQGLEVSRRTVAKYRQKLRIPESRRRVTCPNPDANPQE